MSKPISLFLFCIFQKIIFSQIISGNISSLSNVSLRLEGFKGFSTYSISKTITDDNGNFKLSFSSSDYGLAYLISSDEKPFFVILSNEDVEIKGGTLSNATNIDIIKSNQNQIFAKYGSEHPRREQTLSAWKYLEKIYLNDLLFAKDDSAKQFIGREINKIKKEDAEFLKQLDPKNYVSWYLPVRRLVSDVSIIAQYRPEEIPSTVEAFRKLDYIDERLYKSGLLRDAVDSHFWLLENSGKSLDSVFIEMKISINALLENLSKNEKKLNEITDYLFDLLERHSLFQASEYLALKVLNEVSCTIDHNLAKQLETYRAMKKGKIAPDLIFKGERKWNGKQQLPEKLSEIKSDYVLVAFGAGWCNKCKEEMPQIASLYQKLRQQNVEVVFISLDEDQKQFQEFTNSFPFLSVCDFKKWDSPMVNNYYVFGTPTLFLLNNKREIILRPNSVKQMDAWVDWFLIKKN